MAETDLPLWRQVLDDLEHRIGGGEFAERFPTDRELVDTYGVSRQTVRKAVDRLAARGVIERVRGRGSIVTSAAVVQPLGTLYSLFAAVESHGVTQTSEVLARGWATDERAAARLGQPPGTRLWHLERRRDAGGAPLALDTVWLAPELGDVVADAAFDHTSLYGELADRGAPVPDEGQEVVGAVAADDELRRVLRLDEDEALLRIERLGLVDGRPVECRLTLVRGSRFALLSRWPHSGAATPQLDPDGPVAIATH